MIAAIYARKSTDQNVGDDDKSVTRQVDNAKAFALQRGWTVDDRYIFMDDGVSGAGTKKLVNKQRMLAMVASKKCPFDVIVTQSRDRLSRRDGHESFGELKDIARAGVQVWFYADAQQFAFGTFEHNVTGMLFGEFGAEFRRSIAKKTHEAMMRRASQGHVTGGRTCGYTNVRKVGHVEREINEAEAAVVRDIYRLYADGAGFKQIAHTLNAKQLPSPRPQRGRPAGWDPGTIRAVLKRPIYRGTIVYNRTKKRDLDGSRFPGRAPKKDESLWQVLDAPHLRLVDVELVERVDARLDSRRNNYLRDKKGRLLGSPRRHGHNANKHLLAGCLACACGATFEAVRGVYVCSARRRKGASVCASDLTLNIEQIDHVCLDALEEVVLSGEFIDRVLDATFTHDTNAERLALTAERDRVAKEVTNLTSAIAAGGDIPALAAALQERDKRLKSLTSQIAKVAEPPDRDVLRAALELRTANWREVLRGRHVAQARVVLQHLIDLPIRIQNEPTPKWVAAARPTGLLVGLVQSVASPTGFEPVF